MRFHVFAATACLLLFGIQPSHAEDVCQLVRVAALDMTVIHDRITVPATINGHDVRVALDTGGEFSAIDPDAVAPLGLREISLSGNAVQLFGGFRLSSAARADSFELGKLTSEHMSFSVFPPHFFPDGVAGLIGADVLGNFDVEVDFANSKVNLFRRNDCGEKVIYWPATAWGEADLIESDDNHLVTKVTLDGQSLHAMLDTGAPLSVMEVEYAQSLFGIKDAELKSLGKDVYGYPFKSLSFDALSVSNPHILLLPRDKIGFADPRRARLLIGMDVLSKLHIYISYGQQKIYFTPAGTKQN